MRSPSSCSRAPLTPSGTAAWRPARMPTSGVRVHPPHARAEAQAARLSGGDVLRQQRHFRVLKKVFHELDHRVICRPRLWRVRQMHHDTRLQIPRCGRHLLQVLQAAVEQQQLGGECRIGHVSGLGALRDAAQVQQRTCLLGRIVQADGDGGGQFGDEQRRSGSDLESIRRDVDHPSLHGLHGGLYTCPPPRSARPAGQTMNCRTRRAYNMRMRSGRTAFMTRLLLTVLACAVSATVVAQQSPVSSIRVTGDARVTAKPDRVQIDIGVTTRAAQSQEAAAQNARQVDTMLAAVRKVAGPSAVLKTISYSLNPNYQYHPNGGEPTIDGYTALNVVQVTLDELGKIGAVIDAATESGANHVQGIQFTLRDQDAVRAEALREAALRARTEAEVLAAALGLKVLRVLTVEESSPRFVPMRVYGGARAMATAAAPTPVEAGTLDVTADVTLSVEVAPASR